MNCVSEGGSPVNFYTLLSVAIMFALVDHQIDCEDVDGDDDDGDDDDKLSISILPTVIFLNELVVTGVVPTVG